LEVIILREWLTNDSGLTQKEVANQAEIARTTYAMIKKGNRDPRVPVAKRIASVLGFDRTLFYAEGCHETRNQQPTIREVG
jgi:DNA-binding XRE family transcriptional regulator